MAGGEGDGAGDSAMGQRNTGVGGASQGGRDTGHDLERHVGCMQRQRLLAASAEDQRVAALEADHALSGTRQAYQQGVDVFLCHAMMGAGLADKDALGVTPRHVQHLIGHEAVVHHHIGLAQ